MGKYSIVIVIMDGCCIEAFKRAKTPCINEIMRNGVSSFGCMSVFPSVTYTAHSSIVTGVYPEAHGIVGNCFYDRVLNKIIDFEQEDANKFLIFKTIMERIEGLKICVGEPIVRGCDIIVSKAEIQSKELFEQDNYALEKATELIRQFKPGLLIINLPGVDSIGETYGPMSGKLISHLKDVDEFIGNLVVTAEKTYDDYLLIVLADHGMVSVMKNIDLWEILEGLKVNICVSHRIAHIYCSNENIREIIYRLSEDRRFDIILYGEELAKHRLKNPRSGNIVVAASKGYELGSKKLKGSHGGIDPAEFFVPLIVNKPEYVDTIRNCDITVVAKIVFRYLREKEAIRIVKEKLRNTDPAHGWSHTLRVLKLATELALEYEANVEAVRLGCIFHDVERGIDPKGHELRAAMLAEKYLKSKNSSEDLINKVKKMILKHHSDSSKLVSVEEKILWDADKIDALGLIGLARCFMEAGFFKSTIDDALKHAIQDLHEFKNKMHFNKTRKIAQRRIYNMLNFIGKLKEELKEISNSAK